MDGQNDQSDGVGREDRCAVQDENGSDNFVLTIATGKK